MTARGYLAAGVFVLVLALSGVIWGMANSLSDAKAELAVKVEALKTAEQVNADNVKTIERITALRTETDAILKDVAQTLEASNAALTEATAAFERLENEDPEAKDYLSTPVPDSVRRLLSR